MLFRISGLLGLILAIFLLPWWLGLLLLLILTWRLPFFYEAVAAGVIFDLLYGLPSPGWLSLRFLATIISLILVCLMETIKINFNLFPQFTPR